MPLYIGGATSCLLLLTVLTYCWVLQRKETHFFVWGFWKDFIPLPLQFLIFLQQRIASTTRLSQINHIWGFMMVFGALPRNWQDSNKCPRGFPEISYLVKKGIWIIITNLLLFTAVSVNLLELKQLFVWISQLLLESVTIIVFRTLKGCQHTLLMKMMVVLPVKHGRGLHFLYSPSLFYVLFSMFLAGRQGHEPRSRGFLKDGDKGTHNQMKQQPAVNGSNT